MGPNNIPPRLKLRHAQLAVRRTSFPPLLLNVDTHPDQVQTAIEYGDAAPLYLGPGFAMFLPDGSPDQVQSPPWAASSQVDIAPSSATLQAPFSRPSASTSATSLAQQQPLTAASPSDFTASTASLASSVASAIRPVPTSSVSSALAASSSAQTSSALPSSGSTQSSNSPTPIASQSQSQSRSITALVASAPTFTEAAQSSTTSTTSASSTHFTSSVSSTTASSALASASSTETATHSESLPHLAEIVLGVVAAISIIAVLATLGSWFYKQRKRRNEHAEIASLTSSAYDDRPRGFFGCLKKRRGKNPDDMSELGFGLSHVDFFGAPNSSDEDHRLGLALGPENVLRDEEHGGTPFQPLRDPFASYGFTESQYPTLRPLPAHLAPVDGASLISLSPSRYQHLGGANATPLIVANLAPGDVSSDEGGNGAYRSQRGVGRAPAPPPPVTRLGSLGTPRMENGAPRFTRLNGEGLSVPWAPLHVKSHTIQEEGANVERDFEPLALSRTSTLSLALSRTFSQRLGHSLSRTADWNDGPTRPPRGTFRAAWDETAPEQIQAGDVRDSAQGTWAATIRNNFYNALSAMGGGSMGARGGAAQSNSGSVSTLPNPYSETSRQSSMRFPFRKPRKTQENALEDILSPPPAMVGRRTKGSIIRGNLGIDRPVHVGLGIDALSRSSTLSTSWSDAEKVSENPWRVQHARVLGRDMQRTNLLRTGTGGTASSSSDEAQTTPKQMEPGQTLRATNRRPRYSRMPISQSSLWSSESFASSSTSAIVERRL